MRTCLILGGADCLKADMQAYCQTGGPVDGIVACNEAGIDVRDLNAWVTLHPKYWVKKGWLAKREANGFDPAPLYTHELPDTHKIEAKVTTYTFPGQEHSGSSGMFAAKVALIDLGFDLAVLCGIPMTSTPHFFDPEPWRPADRYLKRWATVPQEYRDRVRSTSGATRELLGAPD